MLQRGLVRLVVLSALTVSACGSDPTTPRPSPDAAPEDPSPDAARKPDADAKAPDSAEAGTPMGTDARTDVGTDVGVDVAPCAPAGSLVCDPLRAMPKTIKELGIFPAAPDFSMRPAQLREFVPDPPLWSNGLDKQRFLVLPEGKKIDNSNRKIWLFPSGTVFIKTFLDDGGAGGKPRAIETRFIRARGDAPAQTFEYFAYRWNAAGTDADLVIEDMPQDIHKSVLVPVTVKRTVDGKPFMINGGQPFMHEIPSRDACSQCHGESVTMGQSFIGFDELRLNAKRTPTATRTQLEEFASLFTQPIPSDPATIKDATVGDNGRMLRIKRFVFGNCLHCHNGGGGFNIHPDVFAMNTVNQPEDSQGIEAPEGWLRILPRDPEKSILFVQARRRPLPPPVNGVRLRAMPPVGVAEVAPDPQFIEDLRAWILDGAR